MIKVLFILFGLISKSDCLLSNIVIKNNLFNNKPYIKKSNTNRISKINLVDYNNLIDYNNLFAYDILSNIKQENGENIIRYVTEFLPYADGIGKHVLHANEYLIKIILDNNYLPEDIKKTLILDVIKMTLSGDSMVVIY